MSARLKKADKVLCCCAGGKVRSVSAKYVLEDRLGFRRVLSVGLEKLGPEDLEVLFAWADRVLVVGEEALVKKIPPQWGAKVLHVDVGPDVYFTYFNPALMARVGPELDRLVSG